mgnify:FL=1
MEFEFIKTNIEEGIPYETVRAFVVDNVKAFYEKFENESESGQENNIINIDITSGEKVEDEIEQKTETEKEITKVSTDAECVKEIYKVVSPMKGIITSRFGNRVSDNPIVSSYHTGLDIGADMGTLIKATHDGVVTQAGDNGTYGKSVTIESGDLKTIYAHCSSVLVKKGKQIKTGENIAKVGMTGNATGPHLHFEIRKNGKTLNPQNYL